MKLKKRDPSDPEVTERVLANVRAMSPDALWQMLTYRKEDVEQTDMNEALKQFYHIRKNHADKAKVA